LVHFGSNCLFTNAFIGGRRIGRAFFAQQKGGAGDMPYYSGTSSDDTISGSAGDDTIDGGAGNDVLTGGDGYDVLNGGDGDDWFLESNGLDIMDGGAGADRLVLSGTRTDYLWQAMSGGASVQRPDNSAVMYLHSIEWVYLAGEDALVRIYELTPTFATEDMDVLFGTDGDDVLEGLGGSDDIFGFDGVDTARYAGSSTDYYYSRTGDMIMIGDLFGSEGFDHLYEIEFFYFAGDDVLLSLADMPGRPTEGDDVIVGSSRSEELLGQGGDDTLIGGGECDYLYGGAGADLMIGGTGDDCYEVDDAGDVVSEDAGEGEDCVYAVIDYTLPANVEMLVLFEAATSGTGNGLANSIWANWALGSHLRGMGGDDWVNGQSLDDILEGGAGADTLTGRDGADVFRFVAVSDSTAAAFDTITDFLSGTDLIDLAVIDADPATTGDDAFTFIADAAFSALGASSAGELRAVLVAQGVWQAEGDTDGDGIADFVLQVVVEGTEPLAASDFIL
jgi:Ca2+-binding RTX toxin-like protein